MPKPSPLARATLLLVSTLTVMAGATISPCLPAMQLHFAELSGGESDLHLALLIRLVLTLPALLIVIASPIAGWAVDRWGRKPLLLGAALLYGVAGSSGFWVDTLTAVLVGRAFLGLAVAGVMVSATTLIADFYQGEARAQFMGWQAAFMGLGGVVFLSLGGTLADVSWRFPFLIYLAAWGMVPLIGLVLQEPVREAKAGPGKPEAIAPTPTPAPIPIPWQRLSLIYGLMVLCQMVFYLIPVQLPFYLAQIGKTSGQQSGLAIAFCTLFASLASFLYGQLRTRLDFASIMPLMFALMGLGYFFMGRASNYAGILAGLAIAGLGLGLVLPNLNLWTATVVPDAIRGRALGGLSTALFLGQFLSPIFGQPLTLYLGLAGMYSGVGIALMGLALLLAGQRYWLNRQVLRLNQRK